MDGYEPKSKKLLYGIGLFVMLINSGITMFGTVFHIYKVFLITGILFYFAAGVITLSSKTRFYGYKIVGLYILFLLSLIPFPLARFQTNNTLFMMGILTFGSYNLPLAVACIPMINKAQRWFVNIGR